MECKQALKQSEGDMDGAIEFLRKKGTSKAVKKADRSTREGAVSGSVSNAVAALVEVKCETDFVARNEKFQALAKSISNHVAASDTVEDSESIMNQAFAEDPTKTVRDVITESIHEMGENITIGRHARFELEGSGGFGLYIHGVGGIGSLVMVSLDSEQAAGSEGFATLCHDLAMHVAAANPMSISADDLPAETVEKEKEIFEAQVRESGKPEKIIPKIIEGKIRKYYTEVCLLEQAFVKEPDISVNKRIQNVGAALGAKITVKKFSRFQLGE